MRMTTEAFQDRRDRERERERERERFFFLGMAQ